MRGESWEGKVSVPNKNQKVPQSLCSLKAWVRKWLYNFLGKKVSGQWSHATQFLCFGLSEVIISKPVYHKNVWIVKQNILVYEYRHMLCVSAEYKTEVFIRVQTRPLCFYHSTALINVTVRYMHHGLPLWAHEYYNISTESLIEHASWDLNGL